MKRTSTADLLRPENQALVESGLNLIQQGLSIFNADMELVLWNRRFIDMFELPEEIVYHGAPFREINLFLAKRGEYGPGDPEELTRVRVERARAFQPHYFERTRPNGRMISVEGHPLAQGGWVTVYSDITETRRQEGILKARSDLLSDRLLQHSGKLAETNRQLAAANRALQETKNALEASEARMRTITSAMPAHIAYLDRSYVYRFTNNRFRDVMGLDRDALIGKPVTDFFPPNIFARVKPAIDRALAGRTAVAEYEIEGSDGEVRSIRSTFTPEFDEDENVPGTFVLSIDRTEEKAATELLVRTKRMETTAQLTSGLAHDFSNILTIVLVNLARIGKADIDDTRRQELIRSTERAARRGTRIIDNLMTFLFRQRLDAKSTNVSAILRELVRLFRASTSDSIEVVLDVPDRKIEACLDEGAFQDAVLNILFNARDAVESAHGGGTITIDLEVLDAADRHIQVRVRDTGPGFSDEALRHGHEPFFTTKPQGKGSGLGLSMVRNFADRSGGKLLIGNGSEGGAEVRLLVPVDGFEATPVEENGPAASMPHVPPADGVLVLVVDDDPEMRTLLRDHVAELGYSVMEAGSGEEAKRLVDQVHDIRMVISDIVMPGKMNGLELAGALRAAHPALPILLVSGLPPADPAVKAAKDTFPVLRKPFTRKAFANFVAGLRQEDSSNVT
ncbi:PAS-domain containing protein [Oricola thermophila]|uniref:histidine kinase n=1 Tax=Oricola thermophila TaxID=2742145 RepID=A0A6N1VD89_9HYPH|nr:PAS-domain containing protein [Oricola thermophila]QKV16997.1 PAS-domain containing protein [Oricola thermophila]